MRKRLALVVLASAAIAGGCTVARSVPATTPDVPRTTTTTQAPTITPTTTTQATTTTIDRIAEIQAIFEDLERRRLQAIFNQDEEAFRNLFTNSPYLERSMEAFQTSITGTLPVLTITVLEVLRDDKECLVIMTSTVVDAAQEALVDTATLQPDGGNWLYAYVEAGRGKWLCEGPHPLSG